MAKITVKTLTSHSLIILLAVCVSVQASRVTAQDRAPVKGPTRPIHKPTSFTNSDVIELVKAGFSDDLIVIRIRQSSEKKFDLSNHGMLDLKAAGVSERLIAI